MLQSAGLLPFPLRHFKRFPVHIVTCFNLIIFLIIICWFWHIDKKALRLMQQAAGLLLLYHFLMHYYIRFLLNYASYPLTPS